MGNDICVYMHMFQYLSTGSEYPSMIIGDAELEEPQKKVSVNHPIKNEYLLGVLFVLFQVPLCRCRILRWRIMARVAGKRRIS